MNGPPLRSLKPWCVDLIRYGARSSAMRREGRDKAVYKAVYGRALSGLIAGWILA